MAKGGRVWGKNASGCEAGVSLVWSTNRGSKAGSHEADASWEK